MTVDWTELRLVWPADLFVAEARALLDMHASTEEDVGFLLDEAFHGQRALKLFHELNDRTYVHNVFADQAREELGTPAQALVHKLVNDVDNIAPWAPRRYFSTRQAGPSPESLPLTLEQVRTCWADLVVELESSGYLDDEFGSRCPDADHDSVEQGRSRLKQLLDTDDAVWPLIDGSGVRTGVEKTWSHGRFADMVEVVHDLVARPRSRWFHAYHDDYDFSDFARVPGRALYR